MTKSLAQTKSIISNDFLSEDIFQLNLLKKADGLIKSGEIVRKVRKRGGRLLTIAVI